MISLLVSLGADVQRTGTEGMTLIEYAEAQGAENMIPYFEPTTYTRLSTLTLFQDNSEGHTTTEVDTSSPELSSDATLSDEECCSSLPSL